MLIKYKEIMVWSGIFIRLGAICTAMKCNRHDISILLICRDQNATEDVYLILLLLLSTKGIILIIIL